MKAVSRRMSVSRIVAALGALLLAAAVMGQGSGPAIDTGDTAWLLAATALVLLMTPGLALFYGGMVRRKNVLGTMMQSCMAMAVISIQWVLYGYSLAFGPTVGGYIGSLAWIGRQQVGATPNTEYGATVPHLLFMAFQMMFAIITPPSSSAGWRSA